MSDCERWIALSDREALGEALAGDDRVFLAAHAERCPGCAGERDVWGALESLGRDPSREPSVESPAPAPARRPVLRARGVRIPTGLAAAAAAAVLLLGGAGWWLRDGRVPAVASRPPTAAPASSPVRLGFLSGDADVDGAPSVAGATLGPGAVVSAHAGTACLSVGDGIRACLAPGARVRVMEVNLPSRRLAVLAGRVVAELEPQPPGSRFTLDSRDGSATAIGTAFSVEVPEGSGPVITRVLHGTVLVQPTSAPEKRVGAHAQSIVGAGPVTPLPDADEQRERAVLVPAVASGEVPPAVVRVESEPSGAIARIDGRLAGRTPLSILLDPGEHTVTVESERGASRDVLRLSGGERLERRFDLGAATPPAAPPAVAPEAPAAPAPSAPPPDAPSLLRSARDSARGDPAAAAAAYRALLSRYPSSPEAVASELPYGELQLGALGDAAGALRTFDRYLDHGGPLGEEASYGRTRALRALGRTAEERAAIQGFLVQYPGGAAASALRLRAAELEGAR